MNKVEKFEKQRNKMLKRGIVTGKIFPYTQQVFDNLRPYQIGGIPASILVLITELCNGKCHDRAHLMSLAFPDAKYVNANLESLKLRYGEDMAGHSFVETKFFGQNKIWVVDTSTGLVYDKNYYYKMQKPEVNFVLSKDEVMNQFLTKEIIASNFEQDKYALPLYLPLIENAVQNTRWFGTTIYKDKIQAELALFKTAIGYDDIRAEIDEDMEILRTQGGAKLDEKYKIVRDAYGREISRGGVPNPYYVSPEEIDRMNKEYENCEDKTQFLEKVIEDEFEMLQQEDKLTEQIAEQRIIQINNNPTINFYELESCQ